MMRIVFGFGILVMIAGFATFYVSMPTASVSPDNTLANRVVEVGQLSVWVTVSGGLQAQSVASIASRNNREALLIETVEEGTTVSEGQVLARLDSRNLKRQLHRLQKERELAFNQLQELVDAKHPLQLAELKMAINETQQAITVKQAYLTGSETLALDKLISEQEVQKTRDELNQLVSKMRGLQQRERITLDKLHPSQIRTANSNLTAADSELREVYADIEQSIIRAPKAGVISYIPVPVGGDFRIARVGDSIYPNQPFMVIPDLSQLIVRCLVPETEIGQIDVDAQVVVKPLAYPDMTLEGDVLSIGRVGQQKPGQPDWQRYFPVTIKLQQTSAELRPGLSVIVHIETYANQQAVLLPRTAVSWQDKKPYVQVPGPTGETRLTPLELGQGNDRYFEVINGIRAGDVYRI